MNSLDELWDIKTSLRPWQLLWLVAKELMLVVVLLDTDHCLALLKIVDVLDLFALTSANIGMFPSVLPTKQDRLNTMHVINPCEVTHANWKRNLCTTSTWQWPQHAKHQPGVLMCSRLTTHIARTQPCSLLCMTNPTEPTSREAELTCPLSHSRQSYL